MFTKTAIFIFCFVGIFAVVFSGITPDFYANQASYTASAGITQEIAETFDLANVTLYGQIGGGNMTFEWSSLIDHPSAPQHQAGLPTGQYLEIWWSYYPVPITPIKYLQFRHTTKGWWTSFLIMQVYYKDGTPIEAREYPGQGLIDSVHLVNAWDDNSNASVFQTKTPVTASYLINYNQSKYSTITDAWNGGELSYILSYELDLNATQMSIWGLMGALLTFNAPALGIAGIGGTIITAMIAVPFWVITAILIVKLIFAIIPFVKGVDE
jgi:hypothetical protein